MGPDNRKRVWIAGGDGLVGRHVAALADHDRYKVSILSRKRKQHPNARISTIFWDTQRETIETDEIPDIIIQLSGAGIADARWSASRKRELISSRVKSAETIKAFLEQHKATPSVYVSASAVGFYGDREDEVLSESSGPGTEFMSETCIAWEKAAVEAGTCCQRTVILRIGIVLSMLGGALPKMLMTHRIGVYPYFGDGKQYYPWVHIADLARLIWASVENPAYTGIYNAVAPQSVTNRQIMEAISTLPGMSGILVPAPAFVLRLAMGEMAAVVLNSNRVISERLPQVGFHFHFTDVGTAVADLLTRKY